MEQNQINMMLIGLVEPEVNEGLEKILELLKSYIITTCKRIVLKLQIVSRCHY